MKAKIRAVAPNEARVATIRAILKLEAASRGELESTIVKFAELLIAALADCPNADTSRVLEMNYICHILDVHRGCLTLIEAVAPPTDATN